MAKLPAFQFYPGDWRKDVGVQSLSYHDRGVWWEMLCLMHESERRGVLVLNDQPMGEEALSRLLGLDKQILTTTLTSLLTSGVASREDSTGAIFCRRMVRDEYLRKVRSEAGSKGGNPILLNQKQTTPDKLISTPSSSSSLKTSTIKPSQSQIDTIYGLYPKKVGKKAAHKAIAKALKEKPFDDLLLTVQAYCRKVSAEGTDQQFIPNPATWFNQGRYDDELTPQLKNHHVQAGAENQRELTDAEQYEKWDSCSDEFKKQYPWRGEIPTVERRPMEQGKGAISA